MPLQLDSRSQAVLPIGNGDFAETEFGILGSMAHSV
jgi:hypothetical protein